MHGENFVQGERTGYKKWGSFKTGVGWTLFESVFISSLWACESVFAMGSETRQEFIVLEGFPVSAEEIYRKFIKDTEKSKGNFGLEIRKSAKR